MKEKVCLINGDRLVNEVATTAEKKIVWCDGVVTHLTDIRKAITLATRFIEERCEPLNAEVVLCWNASESDGCLEASETIECRKARRRPLAYDDVKTYLSEAFESVSRPGLTGAEVITQLLSDRSFKAGQTKIELSVDNPLTLDSESDSNDCDEDAVKKASRERATVTLPIPTRAPSCEGVFKAINV